jgi:hypothetical protein
MIQVFWNGTQCQLVGSEHFKQITVPSYSDTPVGLPDPEDEGISKLIQSFSTVYTDLMAALQNTP